MAHICENDMIQLKDMFPIVAMWLQFSTEEYIIYQVERPSFKHYNFGLLSSPSKILPGQVHDVLCQDFNGRVPDMIEVVEVADK